VRFWNSLHKVRTKANDMKAKLFWKSFEEGKPNGLNGTAKIVQVIGTGLYGPDGKHCSKSYNK